MKFFTLLALLLLASVVHADQQERVNYHMRSMQDRLESQSVKARLESQNAPKPKKSFTETQFKEEPLNRRLQSVDSVEARPLTKEEYIEEFKRNASKKGIEVEVDPKTLDVRRKK